MAWPPASRTLGVATAVAGALSAELGVGQSHLMVDLAEHAGDLFDWGAPGLVQLTAEVASAGLIVAPRRRPTRPRTRAC